jgi:dihydrofolate reductase
MGLTLKLPGMGRKFMVANWRCGATLRSHSVAQRDGRTKRDILTVKLMEELLRHSVSDLAVKVIFGLIRSARNTMSKLLVQSFGISIDGYGAGPNQDLQNPLGVRGLELMEWFFHTRIWRRIHADEDGETGIDNGIAEQGFAGIGAWILGRNMFGPVRGAWPDDSWRGWWGEEPPYHVPVFVLTHHPRAPLKMAGGTEFRFVTGGIHAGLEQATAAAGGLNVRLGGGVATIRQYLRAALIDELHLAISPVLLGSGEHLLNDLDLRSLGYECAKHIAGERAAHVFLRKRA